MNIGFDLDRIFINYPPFAPPALIDWLYKNHTGTALSYSIPKSNFSKMFRRISHFSLFRPKIVKNINLIKNFPDNFHLHKLYLISGRYGFLEKKTLEFLKKTGLTDFFYRIYLNNKDEQPHIFKEHIINKNKIDLYIDDDLALLKHLHKTCPQVKLLWYNPYTDKVDHDIQTIRKLAQVKDYLK